MLAEYKALPAELKAYYPFSSSPHLLGLTHSLRGEETFLRR